MNFWAELALILLILTGYSSGAVIAGRGRREPLGLVDFGMAILLLAMALGTRSVLGKWLAIPIWFILAGLGSAIIREIRHIGHRKEKVARVIRVEKSLLRRTWDRWKVIATDIGNYQGRMLFVFFYFVIVMPFGIGVRLLADPLKRKQGGDNTCWSERTSESPELETAREQF